MSLAAREAKRPSCAPGKKIVTSRMERVHTPEYSSTGRSPLSVGTCGDDDERRKDSGEDSGEDRPEVARSGPLCSGAIGEDIAVAVVAERAHHSYHVGLARGMAVEREALRRQHCFGRPRNHSARQPIFRR